MPRSLTSRIIVLSIFWIVIALVVIAILMTHFYRQHVEEHYDAHVFTHLEELIAAMETTPEGGLRLSREPTDPRFYRPGSGWYWTILHGKSPVLQSSSLGEGLLDLSDVDLTEGHDRRT